MILTGFQSGHGAQSLSPHTALEPPTHMGAIICKVAAVAPGNDLKVLSTHVCVCVRARVQASVCDPCRACLLSVITSNHLQRVAAERERRVGEAIRGDYCAVLNPKLSRPRFPP